MDNSGDYISRDAAREAVWQILNGMGYSEKHNDRLVEEVDAVLDDIPAADVRPVVLCRDCKYWFNAPAADGFNSCERDALIRHEDFFCAAGEKREES